MTTPKDEKGAEPALDRVPFLIRFDDHDREDVLMIGEEAARRYYKMISGSWNAHLFVKIDSNSRDETYPSATLATPPGELDSAREALRAALEFFEHDGSPMTDAKNAMLNRMDAALSDMKGKPPHYGPGSGERPQGGIPVQDGG
jgi:hypothetical protein